jgi:hypothetical protein
MLETKELINAAFMLVVAIISLVPLTIFYKSYLRVRNRKFLMVTAAFLLFFIQAIFLSMRLLVPGANGDVWYKDDEFWWSVAAVLDVLIILLFTLALTSKT